MGSGPPGYRRPPRKPAHAEHLKTDLARIANRANQELAIINRAGLAYDTRQAHEARVIAEARAHALQRVESALRQLPPTRPTEHTDHPHTQHAERVHGTGAAANRRHPPSPISNAPPRNPNRDTTQVIPAATAGEPTIGEPAPVRPERLP